MKIHSIFQSINGEVTSASQGSICTFIRTQGCSAGCKYCDTKDSQDFAKGEESSIPEIIKRVKALSVKTRYITITGGEPLEQSEELLQLIKALPQTSHITLETNGMHKIDGEIHRRIDCIVMDHKVHLLGSTCVMKLNFHNLGGYDWVKVPIQSKTDFNTALAFRKNFYKGENVWTSPKLAFSAVAPATPKQLLSWMFAEKVTDVVLNVQIHKLIGVA